MIKLEQNAIELNVRGNGIKKTIRQAVSNIYEKTEKKNIEIYIEETADYVLLHDSKWTGEVLILKIMEGG